MASAFFTDEWAQAVREAFNTEPTEEEKADKLVMYWDWIKLAKETFTGRLALGVLDPPGADEPSYVVLDFTKGDCTKATVTGADGAEESSFALAGRYDDWRAIMSGFDTNKAVMYRKLMLKQGDVFRFFDRVYYFTEALGRVARVPTSF